VSTDTTQERRPADPETRPATEWMKGARTAHELIVRQVETGHSADRIAERWDEALVAYDDATATPAEREWHAGAEETARDMIQTWRDVQRAEAEQAQAARDARDGGKACGCDSPVCRSGELPSALQEPAGRQPEPEREAEAG
jgi:hypothetical protein